MTHHPRQASIRAKNFSQQFWLLLFILAWISGCSATKPDPVLTTEQRQLNLQAFEHVWKTIHEKHWDPNHNGIDWAALHAEYKPKIEQAQTMSQTRVLLSEMIGRLKQTHFAVIPHEIYTQMDRPSNANKNESRPPNNSDEEEGTIGIDVRVLDGQALVFRIDPDSPASQNGVLPGWQILAIDQKNVDHIIHDISEQYHDSTLRELILSRAIQNRLSGPIKQSVKVKFLNGQDQEVETELNRSLPRGNKVKFGNMPSEYIFFESRKVAGNIGYIRFNMFMDLVNTMKSFEEAIKTFKACDGIIIDLRGNPGGIGGMAMGMAGWFVSQPDSKLGTMYMRGSELKFVVNPRMDQYAGPLAILTDGGSASTSEIFSGGMKDLGRARLFGSRTAAAALPANIDILPNGDGFMYAIANYISEGGQALEANGVTPHQEIWLTRKALLADVDPVLQAAIDWINTQHSN